MKNMKPKPPRVANVRAVLAANWKYLRRNFARSERETARLSSGRRAVAIQGLT